MKILITGGCGFVGSNLGFYLKKKLQKAKIYSIDNLYRKGSKINETRLKKIGIKNFKIDISNYKSFKKLPVADLIIDCCAEPSIEVSKVDMDRVINTNFLGTYNILKKCILDKANIIFLSSSRVYSISKIRSLVKEQTLKKKINLKYMINEKFDTFGVKSIYGLTKLASEQLIREINFSHGIKYLINRFGVISGPWQFGKQDQGFVALWVARHLNKKKLSYRGFGGNGHQSRDIIHIDDVCDIIFKQISRLKSINNKVFNIGGGRKNNISLRELTSLCEKTTGNKVKISKVRETSNYDIPFFVTDNSKIKKTYNWVPKKNIRTIINDISIWIKNNKQILNFFK